MNSNIEVENSLHLDEIIDIIDENEELILYDYNGKDDQILIKDELKGKIFALVKSIKDEKIDKKELIKYAVREAFELDERDIVMLKKDCIFIKFFGTINKHEVLESEKNTIAARYNGFSEDDLKAFDKEHFSSEENKDFFLYVAETFVDKYLLEKKINNQDYEKNVFAYIQFIITEELINTFDYSEEFFKGFSGYIFRIHFKEVFGEIAELILAEIANSNDYMIEFLKYYSLDVVVVDGKKYKVPVLEAENGLKWNVLSMLSIVKLYTKTKSTINLINKEIDEKEEELFSLYVGKLSPIEYNKKLIEERQNLTNKLAESERELDKYYDSLKLSKDEEEKDDLRDEIDLIKKDMQEIREKNKEVLNKVISRDVIQKFTSLDKKVEGLIRQLKQDDRVLEQNEESFSSIKNSLVKALMSKKQPL
jgi:hypothetical protein